MVYSLLCGHDVFVFFLAILFFSFVISLMANASPNGTPAPRNTPCHQDSASRQPEESISFGAMTLKVDQIKEALLSRQEFHPYPQADQRGAWETLPSELLRQLIQRGEAALDYDWPNLPVIGYLDFKRDGDRVRFEKICSQRRRMLNDLVLAECAQAQGRFLDQIINGLWATCEETSWVLPAHISAQKTKSILPDKNNPYIDLLAGETAKQLAYASYLLRKSLDQVSPMINQRIEDEIRTRILIPYLQHDYFWWFGFEGGRVNNWNPWCNANCLLVFLLIEDNPQLRIQAVQKVLKSLDCFLQAYHSDGGCDEGPSYWRHAGGSLFDALDTLYQASDGKINLCDQDLIRKIGQYIYHVHIYDKYYINFADASLENNVDSDLLYSFGKRIADDNLVAQALAAFHLNRNNPVPSNLPAIFNYSELKKQSNPSFPYVRDGWMDGIQVMAAREIQGDAHGFFLGAKGGTNDESHNHNDVGNFIIFYDGQPLIIDLGVETYTAKTFSPDRYDIWTMQSQYHNLPTVNQLGQLPGPEYHAKNVACIQDDKHASLSLDIAEAYPDQAGIQKWQRTCSLHRGDDSCVTITDDYEFHNPVQNLTLTLMTPCEPQIDNETGVVELKLAEKTVTATFDPTLYTCHNENITIKDAKLQVSWGNNIFRLLLIAKQPIQQHKSEIRFAVK